MRVNILREALNNDEGSLGCRVASSWPSMVGFPLNGARASFFIWGYARAAPLADRRAACLVQIELLGYSGQFDYPEFLCEVRRSGPADQPAPRLPPACVQPLISRRKAVLMRGRCSVISLSLQYAPYDLYALDNIGRAVDMFPHMTGMAKLDQAGRLYWGPRISGAGIQNILWADPRTVQDVEECVAAMRYEGTHTSRL